MKCLQSNIIAFITFVRYGFTEIKDPVADSVSCLAKIASNTELTEKTKRHAAKILKKAEAQHVLGGKDPVGMAAAALYIASHETGNGITQRAIAEASGMTEVTIRNRYKNLQEILL